MAEVLEVEAGIQSEALTEPKRQDVEEVLNYRSAMRACVSAMEDRPLSQQMIRSAHGLLLRGVRGRDKMPGSYRTIQNWIGPTGCTVENANFVPIRPEYVNIGMDTWEKYLNSTTELDTLVQLAILHVEFEAIHPFLDGNGRLGRMLIPLFLYQRKMLSSPDFYISGYLETNGDEYRERLRDVSENGDWTGWCEFFLKGIKEQAAENERRARAILELYERIKLRAVEITHSQHAIRAVDFLFRTPIFSGPTFTNFSGIPRPTAGRILTRLRDEDIIQPIVRGRGRRPGIFAFRQLINIAEGRIP